MVRVVGAVVVVQMAGTTRRRSTCISVRMAFDASRCCMRTMQWECGVVMIEGCRTPIRFVVALRTVSWEARGRVVRSGRAVVVIHMARIARSWCACISISVAFNTSCSDVRSVQWESRVIMIETRRAPIRFVVALRAVSWEARGGVVRSRRAVVIIHMACITRRGCSSETIRMALDTSCSDMRSVKRESCVVVIEGGRYPTRYAMT